MNRILTKRVTLALVTAAVACLALAVLLWGTEYKVSLYPHHYRPQRAVPVAKLLSERERPTVDVAVVQCIDALALPTFLSLGLLLTFAVAPDDRDPSPSEPLAPVGTESIHRIGCLIHFSFRPPPPVL
jgi:hypothetical protein